MHLSVRDEKHTRQPVCGRVGQTLFKRFEQERAVLAAAIDLLHAGFKPWQGFQAIQQGGQGGIGLLFALGEKLRGRTIDKHQRSIGHRFAVFEHKLRIKQTGGKHKRCQQTIPASRKAFVKTDGGDKTEQSHQRQQDGEGQKRGEAERGHGHRPNRSSNAGTCT